MIRKISYFITNNTNPYNNLAMEEFLLQHVGDEECILYLWQNEKTVVIGKNQNPWKECKTAVLEMDGGKLVRRLSGGGAVFHDLGNLNFTFLVTKENYDLERQMNVILEAVKSRGIPALKTGRNDISVEEKKFSGNAFYSDGYHNYHHGTILVNVDMKMLSHYLNVSREKLETKGVESVRSRVTNLVEYDSSLSIDIMKKELIRALEMVYGLKPEPFDNNRFNEAELEKLEEKFSSWDWIYGKKMEFQYSMGRRYPWGDIEIKLAVHSGIINDCLIYSDSLETHLFDELCQAFKGCSFSTSQMLKVLEAIKTSDVTQVILEDIKELVKKEDI